MSDFVILLSLFSKSSVNSLTCGKLLYYFSSWTPIDAILLAPKNKMPIKIDQATKFNILAIVSVGINA